MPDRPWSTAMGAGGGRTGGRGAWRSGSSSASVRQENWWGACDAAGAETAGDGVGRAGAGGRVRVKSKPLRLMSAAPGHARKEARMASAEASEIGLPIDRK